MQGSSRNMGMRVDMWKIIKRRHVSRRNKGMSGYGKSNRSGDM